MALNIDTIRSLDASKTYYLANSTGQIKEAGAWQKFKCYFGIGDARQKVQKLIDQVKVALLAASHRSQPTSRATTTTATSTIRPRGARSPTSRTASLR